MAENCNYVVGYDSARGRFLQAEDRMEAGAVVLEELPYAGVLNPEFKDSHCSYCFRQFNGIRPVLRCPSCGDDQFCCQRCLSAADEEYHWLECKHKDLMQLGSEALLAARLLLASDPEDIDRAHCHRKSEHFSKVNVSRTSDLVLSLLTHKEQRSGGEIQQYKKFARKIVHLISQSKAPWKNIDKDALLWALLRHMMQIQCNVHAVTVLLGDQHQSGSASVESQSQVRLALAIYPKSSLLNHSCDPNVIASYQGRMLTVRVTKSVQKGDEFLHCYGPHFARMAVVERRKALKEQYYFDCKCSACVREEAENRHGFALMDAFACDDCYGLLKACDAKNAGICSNCQKMFLMEEKLKVYSDGQRLYGIGVVHREKDNLSDALEAFQKCLKVQKCLLHLSSKTLGQTHDSIAEVFACLGSFEEASNHCQLSCSTVQVIYGGYSLELANEFFKLSQLQLNARLGAEALVTVRKAISIFNRYCGGDDERILELKQMEAFLIKKELQT